MAFLGWLLVSFAVFCVLCAALLIGFAAIMQMGEHEIAHPGPYPNLPRHPARWLRDPTQRHQYRYWNAVMWTDEVSDHGVVSIDPITDADVFVPSSTSVSPESRPMTPVIFTDPSFVPEESTMNDSTSAPTKTYTKMHQETHHVPNETQKLRDQILVYEQHYAELRARVEQDLERIVANPKTETEVRTTLRSLLDWIYQHRSEDDTLELPPSA